MDGTTSKYGTPHCSGGNLPPPGPQGRKRGTFTFVTAKPETSVIQALSVSGVEESTTWDNEPPQGKTCCLGRFLGSLRSLGMTCREGSFIHPNGVYSQRGQPLAGAGWRWVNAATLRILLYVTGVAAAICRQPAQRAGIVVRSYSYSIIYIPLIFKIFGNSGRKKRLAMI